MEADRHAAARGYLGEQRRHRVGQTCFVCGYKQEAGN
ncbi:MAG: hypothetical protein BWY79_00572 [Actinobacteria bacterium ADurb.Bin444]|nr:MAG: hypothetical protein BWY79_00572 [Actinobacteria bacterium ADurb.Bin444]